ncbi:MAG: LUD domain-containing protein, partial [Euryarchaeota archaeon]|nr:LUD domain-containing protein [Euryarchaeota archaeon]
HPTGPVAHLSAKDIAKRLSAHYNKPVKENPEEIVKIVREDVISNLEKANIGITGANAITAEEGSILMTHNEGNIHEVMRKEKHIVVTSIDKIYTDIEDAVNMIKILSFNATGSIIPSFLEVITGVSKTADVEKKFIKGVHNPSEIILILIDNKRSELVRNGFKELLYCIGCGNCLLYCPMYNTIGNEYAIDNNLGGKGIAYHSLSNNEKNEKLELCLTCDKCKENCPLELDIPAIIKKIRSDGISSEIYYFLKSHMIWVYYQLLLRLKIENS